MTDQEKTIIVSTIIDSFNYGTVLQALATNEIMGKYGKPIFVDYIRRQWTYKGWKFDILHNPNFSSLLNRVRFFFQLPNRKKSEKVFRPFVEQNLNLISVADYKELALKVNPNNVFCVGSDQTWNAEYNDGLDSIYFLKDVANGNIKIAFCASFGRGSLSESEAKATKAALDDYEAISVRESSGVDILSALGISSTYLFDPVLLCDPGYWKRVSKKNETNTPYILLYVLNENKDLFDFAKELAKSKDAEIKIVTFDWKTVVPRGFHKEYLPSIDEWLGLFSNAKYVITDSFHGTCFSLLFNKDFYVFDPPKYSVRLHDVLEGFGLQTRNMTNRTIEKASELNWTKINKEIEEYRTKSRLFLSGVFKG